jgi:hypothetical protein
MSKSSRSMFAAAFGLMLLTPGTSQASEPWLYLDEELLCTLHCAGKATEYGGDDIAKATRYFGACAIGCQMPR